MTTNLFCKQRQLWHGVGVVRDNIQIAESTFRLSIAVEFCGGEVFPPVNSGQFIMLRFADNSDKLLGRPLAIYRVGGELSGLGDSKSGFLLEVIYLVVGSVTSRFSGLGSGVRLSLWGPLGRGFEVEFGGHTIIVAGGVGHTPFLMLAAKLREQSRKVTLLYGARNAARVVPLDDFVKLGVDVRIATDDGSVGFGGRVTELIDKVYCPNEPTRILCCGTTPMLRAAFLVAQNLGVPCVVSLESPMGCGLGVCYGCVVKLKDKNNPAIFDYARTCVDGPAFDAYRLDF
jgi:dihydroorotate dehydrogenase electron transfer subunit